MKGERVGAGSAAGRLRRATLAACVWALAVLGATAGGSGAAAQELADYDYEHLSFRGLAFEVGYILPNNVENTHTLGVRVDLGYLGPGLRVVPSVTYWSSDLARSEVRELEERLEDLVAREHERPDLSLGPIGWTDVVLGLDGHFVWRVPFDLRTYAGAGLSAHLLNGRGEAIEETFVEDLLDSVRAGVNVHGGLEYPVTDRIRVHATARYELLDDLRYPEFRFGGKLFFGGAEAGEEREP